MQDSNLRVILLPRIFHTYLRERDIARGSCFTVIIKHNISMTALLVIFLK